MASHRVVPALLLVVAALTAPFAAADPELPFELEEDESDCPSFAVLPPECGGVGDCVFEAVVLSMLDCTIERLPKVTDPLPNGTANIVCYIREQGGAEDDCPFDQPVNQTRDLVDGQVEWLVAFVESLPPEAPCGDEEECLDFVLVRVSFVVDRVSFVVGVVCPDGDCSYWYEWCLETCEELPQDAVDLATAVVQGIVNDPLVQGTIEVVTETANGETEHVMFIYDTMTDATCDTINGIKAGACTLA